MKKQASKKSVKGKYHVVMMTCGYVESQMTSWLIYNTRNAIAFESKLTAVRALAMDMYNKYVEDHLDGKAPHGLVKSCCKAAFGRFCSQCGASLEHMRFDECSFQDFVKGLHSTDCDSYGSCDYAGDDVLVFWPWLAQDRILGLSENEVVILCENAEKILTEALYDQLPDLLTVQVKKELDMNAASEHHKTDWQEMKAAAK